jgi:hypothetical protein
MTDKISSENEGFMLPDVEYCFEFVALMLA